MIVFTGHDRIKTKASRTRRWPPGPPLMALRDVGSYFAGQILHHEIVVLTDPDTGLPETWRTRSDDEEPRPKQTEVLHIGLMDKSETAIILGAKTKWDPEADGDYYVVRFALEGAAWTSWQKAVEEGSDVFTSDVIQVSVSGTFRNKHGGESRIYSFEWEPMEDGEHKDAMQQVVVKYQQDWVAAAEARLDEAAKQDAGESAPVVDEVDEEAEEADPE